MQILNLLGLIRDHPTKISWLYDLQCSQTSVKSYMATYMDVWLYMA